MKVLFVCNNAYNPGNGLSASALNTIKNLRDHGVDARLMAVRNSDPSGSQPDFPLEHFIFPIFEPIVRANGFAYAKIDRKMIEKAVSWADVVHFEEALFLENAVRKIAVKHGKACTATFHLYPHNILANLEMGNNKLLNKLILRSWKRNVFDYCSHIQCPTKSVSEYLSNNGFKAKLHVISNGMDIPEVPVSVTPVMPEPVADILCVGRLAREKAQDTLLDAMRYSRHAGSIRLFFAGKGPKSKLYARKAEKLLRDGVLKHPVTFGFYKRDELRQMAAESYLYVHCAWVEVEGLSCLEATREGLVPVIGKGELVGTTDFALTGESIYPVGDSRELARRIDWWIEHPKERNAIAQRYADAAREYDIKKSIDSLIDMFREAVEDARR